MPVIKLGQMLLVSVQFDLDDRTALALQDDLAERIVATSARAVIIDISALGVVDSFIGRTIGAIAAVSRVLGARTIVAGMRPEVAITLVELGTTLQGVDTALDVERALTELGMSFTVEGDRNDEADTDGLPAEP